MSEIKLKIIDEEFWYECESIEQEKELDEILDKYDKEDKEKDQRIKSLEKELKRYKIALSEASKFSSCNNKPRHWLMNADTRLMNKQRRINDWNVGKTKTQ